MTQAYAIDISHQISEKGATSLSGTGDEGLKRGAGLLSLVALSVVNFALFPMVVVFTPLLIDISASLVVSLGVLMFVSVILYRF
jgi:hypothetical protein